ncbi:unnamed protein product [Cunninghamella blakesleeana]
MELFIKWCYEQGVIVNSVEIRKSENAGYGIFTTNTIKDTSKPYVFIPKKLLITATNLLTEVVATHKEYELFLTTLKIIFNDNSIIHLKNLLQELKNEKLSLRLFLAYELWQSRHVSDNQQQQRRFWKPYFDVLPTIDFFKQHHVLFLQTDKTENPLFALLEGTSLASSIQAKQSKLKREWEQLQQSFGDQLSWLSDLTIDDWFYIDALFWSRVVSLGSRKEIDDNDGEDLALIPYFDFANHQLIPNLRWQLIEENNNINDIDENNNNNNNSNNNVNNNNNGLQLISFINDDDDDHKKKKEDNIILEKDQELCLSYGDKPNQELLFLHGFCLPDNPVSNQITLSFFPFLNPSMQDEESIFKWKWLQQQSTFKPILIIHYLSLQQQQNSSSPIIDLFKATGFTFESICMMYLVVLDQDDGLVLEVEKENKDITETIEKLSLTSNYTPIIQLYLNDDDDDDDIKRENITTFEQLYHKVLLLPHVDVINLRVVTLLMEAIQYHLQQIEMNDIPLESNTDDDMAEQLDILKKSPLFFPIQIYRNEEREILQHSLDALSNLSNSLMESETVLEYLDHMNSMENDE